MDVARQASSVYGGALLTDPGVSNNLQEPPRSLQTIFLCQRERGIHGGMQGAV